jgi:hypothetical protein
MTETLDYSIVSTTLTISSERPAPSSEDVLRLFGSIGIVAPTIFGVKSKSVTIASPLNTDDITFFYTDKDLVIDNVYAVVRGSSPSVTFSLSSGTNRSTITENNINGQTVTNSTTGVSVTIGDNTIPINSWIWVRVTAVGGTTTEFSLTFYYTLV